ncbi:MAG: LAGLIDADG family homing endonuclease [archaeon]|nr:LAGLIDADG family homing endonuclease [archaeon]
MDWDYLAGFIDGEGSIIIKPPRVRIYISNTDKKVLDEIRNFVNCGKVYEINMENKNKKWSKQYCWTICSHKEILKILKNLKGRLIIKEELCEKAINYIENKRWQKYYLSKEELERWKHLGSSRKIAKKLGVSQFSILKYMKKFGLFKK